MSAAQTRAKAKARGTDVASPSRRKVTGVLERISRNPPRFTWRPHADDHQTHFEVCFEVALREVVGQYRRENYDLVSATVLETAEMEYNDRIPKVRTTATEMLLIFAPAH